MECVIDSTKACMRRVITKECEEMQLCLSNSFVLTASECRM